MTKYSAHVYADGLFCFPNTFNFDAENIDEAKAKALELAPTAKCKMYYASDPNRGPSQLITLAVDTGMFSEDQIASYDGTKWGPVFKK
jgi:hypothetical protein